MINCDLCNKHLSLDNLIPLTTLHKNEWETIKGRSTPFSSYNRLYNHCRQSKLHNFQKYPELQIESPEPLPATATRRVPIHVEPEEEEEETQTPLPLFVQRAGNIHLRGLDA